MKNNTIPNIRPAIDLGDFYQLKGEKFCWLILAPIAYRIHQSDDKEAAIRKLSDGQKALFYWWYLKTHTGWGLGRFLELGFGGYLPIIIDGLKLIGNKEGVKLLEEVYSAISKEASHYSLEDTLLEKFNKEQYDSFSENEVLFEEYIRANPDDFITDGAGKKLSTQLRGTFKTHFDSGHLKNEFTLKNGYLEGVFKVYSEESILLKDEFYENGVLTEYTTYTKDGLKAKESRKEGSGIVKIGYDYKGIKNNERYYNKNGERHGLDICYRNGNISFIRRYANGKMIGVHHDFYEEGGKEATYEDFFEKRKLIYFWDRNEKMTVRNGNGYTIKEYEHSNEVKKIITNYRNGFPDGMAVSYLNEQVSSYETYKNGQLHGASKYFDEEGQLKSLTIYENGKKVSSKVFTLYVRYNKKISLIKPQLDQSGYIALLNKMGFSEVSYNGEVRKENVTDLYNIGVFVANYKNVTIVITQDNSGVFKPRQATFTKIEKHLTDYLPNSELLFINHFESPFAQSIHYINNGESIRALEKDSKTLLFSEGIALKEEKEFSRVYYKTIAIQYELIKRVIGDSYPDIPDDLIFYQFVTTIDKGNATSIPIEKREYLLTDIFNNCYVLKAELIRAIDEEIMPTLKNYGFHFDATDMSIHRIKNGLSQIFYLVQSKKNFEVIVPLNFHTKVFIIDEKEAVNTEFKKSTNKGVFNAAKYYPNPIEKKFEEKETLTLLEFTKLFKVYFIDYYLIYFDALL